MFHLSPQRLALECGNEDRGEVETQTYLETLERVLSVVKRRASSILSAHSHVQSPTTRSFRLNIKLALIISLC